MKKRNAKNGPNFVSAGQMAIVGLYSYWEDHYRAEFAKVAGIDPKKLLVPVMGDLRLLRNSIIHHGGIAKKEVERCTTLAWFKENDLIAPSTIQMDAAFDEVFRYCQSF